MSLISTFLGSVANVTGTAVTYGVSTASQVVSEASTYLSNTFGSSVPFAKGAANGQAITNPTATLPSVGAIRQQAGVQDNTDDSHKYQLIFEPFNERVVFEIMPQVTEDRSVQYEAVQPPQFPGAFQKYKGTEPVKWNVQAKLVSRNSQEALDNHGYINRLRSWTLPFFGDNTAASAPGQFRDRILGAPPPVLTFKGLRQRVIGPVKVVITSLNWTWPPDVDYLPIGAINGDGSVSYLKDDKGQIIPFPAVMEVSLQLTESFSVAEFNAFNWFAQAYGDLNGVYSQQLAQPTRAELTEAVGVPQPPANPAIRVGTERGRRTSAGVINATVRVGTEKGRATSLNTVPQSVERNETPFNQATNPMGDLTGFTNDQ